MKFDYLNNLKEHLQSREDISENTAKKYHQMAKKILKPLVFTKIEEVTPEDIERQLKSIKTRNDVIAAKQGLLALKEIYPELQLPESLSEISKRKRNFKKRKFESTSLQSIQGRINNAKTVEYRLAYELMLETGLRVSEVVQITSDNVQTLEDGSVEIKIARMKGGESGIKILEPGRTANMLVQAAAAEKGLLLPSAHNLQIEAARLGIECHDLRRAYARVKHKELRSNIGSYQANEEVRKLMGHKDIKTTKKYLRREISIE